MGVPVQLSVTVNRDATRPGGEAVALVQRRALIKASRRWPVMLAAGVIVSLTAPPCAARNHAAK